jgi:hypothetical protein
MDLVVVQVTDMLVQFVTVFAEIAMNGPLSAILLLFGAGLTLFSAGFFGYLAAGAAFDTLSDAAGGLGRSPPPGAK